MSDPADLFDYIARNGDVISFDTNRKACERFGFFPGTRVNTPRGPGTVIGVNGTNLWFHVDTDRGASFWDNYTDYEAFLRGGFTVLEGEAAETPGVVSWDYKLKRITYKGKDVEIILQNENGPCPLIAICNILALGGKIDLANKHNKVTVEAVISKITEYLKTKLSPQVFESSQDIIKKLGNLKVGLDVNCGFNKCDAFEATSETKLFDLLDIRMLHGWLIEPSDPLAQWIGAHHYNDLIVKVVAALEDNPEKSNPAKNQKTEEVHMTEAEARLVKQFLDDTGHQLTVCGLQKLHEAVGEDELVIFFRNNHFSTLTKHNGGLFNLVTDIGYERERSIVWDALASVDGNSIFCSGDFLTTTETKQKEVIDTALLFGFSRDMINKAIEACLKPNEELKTDDVLAWLNKNATMQPM